MDGQRGFTSLELAISVAILSIFIVATAATFGLRPPRAHAATVALEAAFVEARALASATADESDPALPTGATVYVAPDPAASGSSVITVYRSRPIPNPNPGGRNGPLPLDGGVPPRSSPAALTLKAGAGPSAGTFAVLISSSGYASVAAPLRWDPGKSGEVLTQDPGCADGAVTIEADDGSRRESHALGCRNASYDASR